MRILEERKELRPVIYPEFKEAHRKVYFSPWHHEEVDIEPDLVDWRDNLSDKAKFLIGNLFKGFTLQEGDVNCNWRKIADKFPHPEIVHMASSFSAQECIHALGYDLYDANLPFNDVVTSKFEEDPVAQKKLEAIASFKDEEDLALSIAVFSAFIEGVSLYSSFGLLLYFCRKGYLKAMSQILSWSVKDEDLHSKMGIKLYKRLIKEGYPKPDEEKIYEAAKLVVGNEIRFVSNAFGEHEEIEELTPEMAINFIYHRANKKLMELELKPIFPQNNSFKDLANYFYSMVEGKNVNDFFALLRNGDGYSATIPQKFRKCVFKVK